MVVHWFAELIAPSRLGRSFRWLLASSWVTNLGDGITLAACPLLVASQTRNPLAVAMAAFLQRLPWLLFGLYAGVVADRLNRRAIVITTGLVRVAILLFLTAAILTHRVDILVVLAALTRWAWFALIVFVIFGAHAFIWGTTSPACGSGLCPPGSRAASAVSTSPAWSAAS